MSNIDTMDLVKLEGTMSLETLEDLCDGFLREYHMRIDIEDDYYLSDDEILKKIDKDIAESVKLIAHHSNELIRRGIIK
jgi:hypothetical protein